MSSNSERRNQKCKRPPKTFRVVTVPMYTSSHDRNNLINEILLLAEPVSLDRIVMVHLKSQLCGSQVQQTGLTSKTPTECAIVLERTGYRHRFPIDVNSSRNLKRHLIVQNLRFLSLIKPWILLILILLNIIYETGYECENRDQLNETAVLVVRIPDLALDLVWCYSPTDCTSDEEDKVTFLLEN